MSVSPSDSSAVPSANDDPQEANSNGESTISVKANSPSNGIVSEPCVDTIKAESETADVQMNKDLASSQAPQDALTCKSPSKSPVRPIKVQEEGEVHCSTNSNHDLLSPSSSSKLPLSQDKSPDKRKEDKLPGRRALPLRRSRREAVSKLASSTTVATKDSDEAHCVETEKKAAKRSSKEINSDADEVPEKRAITSQDICSVDEAKSTQVFKDSSPSPEKHNSSLNERLKDERPKVDTISHVKHELQSVNGSVTNQKSNHNISVPINSPSTKAKSQTPKHPVATVKVNFRGSKTFRNNLSGSSKKSNCSGESARASQKKSKGKLLKFVDAKDMQNQAQKIGMRIVSRAVGTQTENDDLFVKPLILKLLDSDEKLKALSGFPSFEVLDHVTDATLKLVTNSQAMISELGPCLREWIIITCFKFLLNLDTEPLAVLFQLDVQDCEQIVQKTSRFLRKSLVLPSCQSFVCGMPLSVLNGIADCTDQQESDSR